LACNLNGSFDQSSVHLPFNEKLSEGHQCSFAKRCLFRIDTIENKLPPPVHYRRLNNFIIGDACVRLQDQRQGEHCWGRLSAALSFPSDTDTPALSGTFHPAIHADGNAETQTI
jgi:hypothetical protein